MANVTIGDLTEKTDVDGTELVEIQDGTGPGASKSLALERLIDATVRRTVLTSAVLSARTAEYTSYPGYVYQDAAGTTPAGVGDPVGLLLDRSGNGNHATQSTTASKPTLRQDSGGRYYLEFDGTDDYLVAPIAYGPNTLTLSAAAQIAGTGSNHTFIGADVYGGLLFQVYDDTDTLRAVKPGSEAMSAGATALSTGVPYVVSFRMPTTVDCEYYLDGQADGGGQFSSAAPATSNFFIGAVQSSGGTPDQHLSGRIYGAVLCDTALPDAGRQRLEQYLAILAGVAL